MMSVITNTSPGCSSTAPSGNSYRQIPDNQDDDHLLLLPAEGVPRLATVMVNAGNTATIQRMMCQA
ncbi:TPA: hypothetical protein JEY56_001599 [Escherichia coli]|nr:hypothetical protein [Escherichia coli]